MATCSRVLAWRIPRTEESGGVQSVGLQRRAQLNNWPHSFIIALLNLYLQAVSFLVPPFEMYTNGTLCVLRPFVEKAMAPYSCLENPMDGGAWPAAVHGVAPSRTRLGNVAAGPLYVLLYIMLIRIGCVDMEPQVIQFHGCRIFHCVNNYKVTVYLSLTILGGLQLCGFFITGMDIMNIKFAWLTFRECRCLDLLGNINFFLKSFVINFSFSLEVSFGRFFISSSNQKGVIHCFFNWHFPG